MEKIYSRRRLKRLKLKKFTKIKVAFGLILLGLLFFIIEALISVYPIFEQTCKSKAESIGTEITSREVDNVMMNYDYDDLFYVERKEDRRNNNDKSKSCSYKQNNHENCFKYKNKY